MYRMFVVSVPKVYCQKWPCDRECGLLHLPLLKITVPPPREFSAKKPKESVSTDSGRPSTTSFPSEFEEIMTRAGQKISVTYKEPPMPPPLIIPDEGTVDEMTASPHVDTTFLFWKTDDLDTPDSEDTNIRFADPPSVLTADSTIDDVISRNRHDPEANPIFHDRIDSRIDSEDDDDYSRLDAPPPKLDHTDSFESLGPEVSEAKEKAKLWRRAHYEPSLDIM